MIYTDTLGIAFSPNVLCWKDRNATAQVQGPNGEGPVEAHIPISQIQAPWLPPGYPETANNTTQQW